MVFPIFTHRHGPPITTGTTIIGGQKTSVEGTIAPKKKDYGWLRVGKNADLKIVGDKVRVASF